MVYTQITKSDYIFLNVSACKGRETHIINGYKIKLPGAFPILKEKQIHVHQSARIVQKYKQNGRGVLPCYLLDSQTISTYQMARFLFFILKAYFTDVIINLFTFPRGTILSIVKIL